jgi:hypothetical protein
MYVCMYAYTHVKEACESGRLCVRLRMPAFVYMYARIFVCIYIYIHTHIHTNTHTYANTQVPTDVLKPYLGRLTLVLLDGMVYSEYTHTHIYIHMHTKHTHTHTGAYRCSQTLSQQAYPGSSQWNGLFRGRAKR